MDAQDVIQPHPDAGGRADGVSKPSATSTPPASPRPASTAMTFPGRYPIWSNVSAVACSPAAVEPAEQFLRRMPSQGEADDQP